MLGYFGISTILRTLKWTLKYVSVVFLHAGDPSHPKDLTEFDSLETGVDANPSMQWSSVSVLTTPHHVCLTWLSRTGALYSMPLLPLVCSESLSFPS